MRYLLDTNAVIAFVGETSKHLVDRMLAAHFDDIGLPSIVVHELAFGAYRSGKIDFNLSRLDTLTRDMAVVDFTSDDARAAGEIRADLARIGKPIGPYDVLIAGQAKARGLCAVTNNTSEFGRVAGLTVEDWTTDAS